MAIAPLNLTAKFQSWHLAGLNYLLLDKPVQEFVAGLVGSATNSVATNRPELEQNLKERKISKNIIYKGNIEEKHFGHSNSLQSSKTDLIGADELTDFSDPDFTSFESNVSLSTVASNYSAGSSKASGVTRKNHSLDAPTALSTQGNGFQSAPIVRKSTDFDAWGDEWEKLFSKVQPAAIAWTYPELGQDLLAQPDARRGHVLRTIISSLKLKKGSSTFWPVKVPGSDNVNADCFHFGLDRLESKYLIVFGQDSLADTDYAHLNLKPFTEHVVDGRLIIALPDFNSILTEQAKLESITVFLRSVFSRYFLG